MNNPFELNPATRPLMPGSNDAIPLGGTIPDTSIWERNDAKDLYLLEHIAGSAKQSQLRDLDYNYAAMGWSPDEIDQFHEQQRMESQAMALVDQGAGMSDSKYKKMLEEQLGTQPQRQDVGPAQLSDGQAILGMLAAVLDPKHAAQSTNIVLQGGIQERDRAQQMADQNFEIQTQQRNEKIGLLSKLMGIEQDDADRLYRRYEFEQKMKLDADQLRQRGEEKLASDLAQAGARYNSANSQGEKELAFGELNRIRRDSGLQELPPDVLDTDIAQMRVAYQKAATTDWEKALSGELNQFGEVDEARAKTLEDQRQAIAKAYGIDPTTLRAVPTAKTLKAEALAQRKAEFDQRLGFESKKWADTLADKLANRDLAERRFMETVRHNQASESLSAYSAQTSRMNYQISEFNALNKQATDGVDEAIYGKDGKGGLQADLAGKRNALRLTTDKKTQEKLQQEISELEGKISYLESTKMPDIPVPPALQGFMGGSTIPNPNYRGDMAPPLQLQPEGFTQGALDPRAKPPIQGPIGKSGSTKKGTKWRVIK